MTKPPDHADLADFINGKTESGLTPNGDLTLEELQRLHAKSLPEPSRLDVVVTDDGYVAVGNDLKQTYFRLTPEETTKVITLLMAARQRASAIRTAKGAV